MMLLIYFLSQHIVMLKNSVYIFFLNLAKYFNVDEKYGWKTELWKKIGKKADIKSANLMHTWITRGAIPEESLKRILQIGMPEDVESLGRDCLKDPGFVIQTTTVKKPLPLITKDDQWYLGAVKDIFISGQDGIIDALKSNIREFYEAVENKKRLLEIENKKNENT